MANLITIFFRARGQKQVVSAAQAQTAAIQGIGTAAAASNRQVQRATKNTAAAQKRTVRSQAAVHAAYGRTARTAKYLGIATVGLGAISYKAAAEYHASLNIFQAVTGANEKQMADASNTAKRLGADIRLPGISAKNAADTLLLLSKAGFTVKQSLEGAEGALLLSRAANMDTAESTTVLARSLKAFEMPATDAVKVVDALAGAELKTTVSMREIADGLTYAATSAHQLNIPMLDTVTALAKLNDAGTAGTKAGTSLNEMLNRMTNPTKKARMWLKALGLWMEKRGTSAFVDMNGEFVGMRKGAELLAPKLKMLNRAARTRALREIFGREGQRGAGAILARSAESWDSYATAVGKTGQASNLANARLKGSLAAIESVKNAWSNFTIAFGEAIAPFIDPLMYGIAKVLNFLSRFPKVTAGVVFGLTAISFALVAMNVALIVAKNVKMLAISYKLASVWTRVWWIWQNLLNLALWASPITWIAAAVILLAVGFYLAYTRVEWFRNAVNATFSWIKRNWPLLLGIMLGPFAIAAYLIYRYFGKIKGFAVALVNGVKALFNGLVRFFRGLPARMGNFLKNSTIGKAVQLANRARGWLPGMAGGGTVARAGAVRVGERGPEVVHLPLGARVVPLEAGAAAGGGFGEVVIPVQVMLDRRVVGQATARWNSDKKARG